MKLRVWTTHRRDAGLYAAPDVVLVKEGFCWPALLVPLVWALWHRMWLTFALLLLGATMLGMVATFAGLTPAAELALGLGAAIYVGMSANDWRRASLRRRGWDEGPAVVAASQEGAELRLFQTESGMFLR